MSKEIFHIGISFLTELFDKLQSKFPFLQNRKRTLKKKKLIKNVWPMCSFFQVIGLWEKNIVTEGVGQWINTIKKG